MRVFTQSTARIARTTTFQSKFQPRVEPDRVHWRHAAADRVGILMGPREPRATIYTDASLKGYGAILGYKTLSGLWPPEKAGTHINDLETEAIWLALQHFAPVLTGRHVLVAELLLSGSLQSHIRSPWKGYE